MNQHTQTELLVSNIQWSHLNAKRSSWEKCLLLSTEDEPWQILKLTEIWWKPSTDLSDFYKLSPRLRQCFWQSDASSVQILRINHSTGNQNVLHILREALSYFSFSQQFRSSAHCARFRLHWFFSTRVAWRFWAHFLQSWVRPSGEDIWAIDDHPGFPAKLPPVISTM